MKKIICIFIFCFIIFNIFAQEMQISVGINFNFGVYEQENTVFLPIVPLPPVYYIFDYNTSTTFPSIGISFLVRVFPESDAMVTPGFVFHDRAIFSLNWKESGYINNVRYSEEFTIDDGMITIMDFGMGISYRIRLSDWFNLYSDLGANLTIMDFDDFNRTTSNYLGAGIFAALSLQMNLSQTLFLELGINSILNAFSSTKGQLVNPVNPNQVVKYKDSGRWDLTTIAAFLHVGWRFDLWALRQSLL
ncbi:MAG: hypothetical protein FWD24_03455 [Treponema sp.]|nr:hypothetical protein [Treponema sp.]